MFITITAALVVLALILKATADAAHSSNKIGDLIEGMNSHDSVSLNQAAQVATSNGYFLTAEALLDKADIAHVIERATTKELPSPIAGVTAQQWRTFVDLFRGKAVSEISPSYQFGLFNIGFRRLADLGLASGVHRGLYNKRAVWFGHFVAPLTVEIFLNDAALQYKVFCKDMSDRHKLIAGKHQNVIGTSLEGVSVTLSGLLAVAKLAGTTGLASWLTDAQERQKFSQTTAAFKAANGVF